VVAFAGKIFFQSTPAALSELADALASVGGRLDLYVQDSDNRLAELGLRHPHIRRIGWFTPEEMAARVSKTADALFLPTAFEGDRRMDAATLFPSKLAEYTAIGLPILAWAPPYSSVVRWVAENPGAAELVTDPSPASLRAPMIRLMDRHYATQIASAGVRAGIRDFSPAAVRGKFMAALAPQAMPRWANGGPTNEDQLTARQRRQGRV
jgi:hypothetical protein